MFVDSLWITSGYLPMNTIDDVAIFVFSTTCNMCCNWWIFIASAMVH